MRKMLEASWRVQPGKNSAHRHLCTQQSVKCPLHSTDCGIQCERRPMRWSFYIPLVFSLLSSLWYRVEAWWGELKLSQRRKREGRRTWPAEFRASLRQEVFFMSRTCRIKMQNCAHRVTTRSDNMEKAVRLGWDLFSLTQDPWHNCPLKDFQCRAFKACQGHIR